ncbi:hypothetical protein M0D69_38745 [Caballeronia sp. SEWSISQ10-4 2]|uniref:hypothetical protein n=1 Tax=Caballeronia sp. SEWSISQ10-4 2 TaxID=2937438 RepID=UPI00264D75AF|nr:hypothetical protein [Caballeronia sp. SEWSISQ10-4 2]MDN7183854.1 hypothetical protein [Caballeronia sp. SEWSISQ10-4 2]
MERVGLFQQCLFSGVFEFRHWSARWRADAVKISRHAPEMAHALNVRTNLSNSLFVSRLPCFAQRVLHHDASRLDMRFHLAGL